MTTREYPIQEFNMRLAVECANAFSSSTGIGCSVSSIDGEILHQVGFNCANCGLCKIAKRDASQCVQTHIYGTAEAERFGGKYIYFCPTGLTCFTSPILGQTGSAAKIVAGPLLMVDLDDFITFDLAHLQGADREKAIQALQEVPRVDPARVSSLSAQLFMSVGFLNNVSESARMLDTQDSGQIQGQISEFIKEIKGGEALPLYPLDTEQQLMHSITVSDTAESQKLLNELLGHIFFCSGGSFTLIKSRVYELLVLISRAAINGGADPAYALKMNHQYLQQIQKISNLDDLCFWLAKVMNRFADSVLRLTAVKHVDVMHKALQYMRDHYNEKIILDEIAQMVYLSPSYFSKIFKAEVGCNFNTYLNRLRIDKSKALLLRGDVRLVEIAALVGFEDQSYFTKVFKRITGVSPNRFKEAKGQIRQESAPAKTEGNSHYGN